MIDQSEKSPALEQKIHTAIESSPFISQKNLRFETQQGRVILRGEVRSYFHKQMAQEAVRGLDGVKAIENQLEVNCHQSRCDPTPGV